MAAEKIKQTGFVYKGRSIENSVKAENVETDNNRQFISKTELDELKAKPSTTSPLSDNTVAFTQAAERTNIKTKETLSTIAGKICKWFNDLGTAAFKGVSTSLTVTADGYVADARVAKTINEKFGGCKLSQEGNDFYITGADSVKKKLGSSVEKITHDDTRAYRIENMEYDIENGTESGSKKWKAMQDYIFDIKSVLPDYLSLTVDSFYFCATKSNIYHYITSGTNIGDPREFTAQKIYDSANGVLRIKDVSGLSNENNDKGGGGVSYTVTEFVLLIIR